MSPAVQPLLLFLLCRDLFNYALVTAGSVLDTAIDTADGRRADLYLFHDLAIMEKQAVNIGDPPQTV